MGSYLNVFVVRQVLLLCATCCFTFSTGVILAFPSVLNPAILAPNADIKATLDEASWIAASHGLAGLVGCAVLSPVFEICGRKMANILMSLFILLGCLIFYVASDIYYLIFARLAQGLAAGGTFLYVIALCECVSPERRGYFMVVNKISLGMGSLACHSLGFILHWRQIALFVSLPICIAILLFLITTESPAFHAMRGHFDKCAIAFEWYRGKSLSATKELDKLVAAQTIIFQRKQELQHTSIFKSTWSTLVSKDFRKSFFIVTLATLCLDFCGRYFLLAYITQMLVELTDNTSFAMHISVVFDGILISALGISCLTVKRFKRRTLLFNLGFCSVFLMFMVSFSIFLRSKFPLLSDVKWLTPLIILLHTFVTNIGLVPICWALTGEVFSLDQRAIGSFLIGIVFIGFYTFVMKVTPMMIEKTGVEGTYSIYGFCLLICLVLLRIILPETKDKTLQQIEDELKGILRTNSDNELLQRS